MTGAPDLKTRSAPALDQALTLLETLAESAKGLTLSELARKLGLPRSSTHRLLLTLVRRGFLYQDRQSGRHVLGLKLFELAKQALNGIRLREQALPFLRALMTRTRLTVHLAVLDQNGAMLVEKVEPPGLLRLATWVGKRMDLHCTGVGKALLAHLPENEADRLIREHGLPRHNENTIASARKLKEKLAEIRQLGYALDDGEDEIGLRCIGAPIFGVDGTVAASISVAGTTAQIRSENLCELARLVKQTAQDISANVALAGRDRA